MFTRATTLTPVELKSAIVRHPLVVSPDTKVIDAIAQISGVRSICHTAKTAHECLDRHHQEVRSSCVMVVEEGQVIGILTERDVVRLSAQQQPLDCLVLQQVMASPVVTLRESAFTDLFSAINLLQQHHIRHLPILDEQDRLVGLLTHESLRRTSRPIDLLRLRQAAEAMTREVICAPPDCSMLAIAQRMADHRVSSVVIVESRSQKSEVDYPETPLLSPNSRMQTPIGIITERDLVQFQALGLNLENYRAEAVMSTPIFAVKPEESLWTVQQMMEQHFIHRLVVTGKQGKLLGIVTQTSVLQALHPLELYELAEFLEKEVVRLEAEKAEKAEREKLVAQIANRIRTSFNVQEILNVCVAEVRAFLACDRVWVSQFQPDWSGVIIAESVDHGWFSSLGNQIHDTCFQHQLTTLYDSEHPVVVNNIYTAGYTDCHIQLLEQYQVKANLAVPIRVTGQLWGLLIAHQCADHRDWQAEDTTLLQDISVQLAIALQQAMAYQQAQTELEERKKAEADREQAFASLQESEQRYTTLAAAAPVGIFRTDAAGRCTYVNDRWSQITGLTPEAAAGEGWRRALHPDDRDWIADEWARAVQENRSLQLEFRFQHPDRTVTWVYGQSVVERAADGQAIGYVGSITDISDRKAAEQALAVQRDYNHLIAEINSRFVDVGLSELDAAISHTLQSLGEFLQVETSYLFRFDAQQNTLSMTYEWCKPGISPQLEQAQNLPWEAFPWGHARLLRQKEVLCVPTVAQLPPEAAIDQANWQRFNLSSIIAAPLIKNSELTGFIGFAYFSQDRAWDEDTIRLLKQVGETIAGAQARTNAEQQVQLNEERLRLALTAANQGLYDLNIQTGDVIVSQEYAAMLGYDPATFKETNAKWIERLHPDERESIANIYRAYVRGEIPDYAVEFRQLTRAGGWKWILSVGKIVAWDEAGNPLRMLGTHTDISDRKQTEAQLQDLITGTAATTGQDFFPALVRHIAAALNVSYALVTEQVDDELHALAFWANGDLRSSLRYHPAKTPCELTLRDGQFYCEHSVQQRFPNDLDLVEMGVESYLGIVLRDIQGKVIGDLCILDQQPIQKPQRAEDLLRVFAARAAAELERQRANTSLEQLNQALEAKVEERTAELQEREKFLQTVLDTFPLSVFWKDRDSVYLGCNRNFLRDAGLKSVSDMIGKTDYDLPWGQTEADAYRVDDQQVMDSDTARLGIIETQIQADGNQLWLETNKLPLHNLKGDVIGVLGTYQDISDRKRAEADLLESEARWQFALEGSGDGIWDWNTQTNTVFFSRQCKAMLGYSEHEIGDRLEDWDSRVHPDDKAQCYADLNRHFSGETPVYQNEYRLRCKDNSYKWILDRGKVIEWTPEGQPLRMIGTHTDISDRKKTEERLRSLSDRLTLAVKSGAIGIWDWDVNQNILTWDDRMYELYGITADQFNHIYDAWASRLHPDDRPMAEEAAQRALAGEKDYDIEFRVVHADGSIHFIKSSALVQRNDQGNPQWMVGMNFDITDQKQAEVAIQQTAAQLAASNRELEAFAYSVSHDLRAPLRAIGGFSNALLEEYGETFDEAGKDYFDRIRKNVARMGLLIDELLSLSRISRVEIRYTPVNLSALAQELMAEFQASEPERQVEFVVTPDAVVSADATLMRLVLTNLLQNAWKFTRRHSLARIEFGVIHAEGQPTYFVRDDGAGFDMAYSKKLFGVFQRLHTVHEFPGTGIGLATVQRIIHRHGGRVWAEGAVEQGATVYFTMPDTPSR